MKNAYYAGEKSFIGAAIIEALQKAGWTVTCELTPNAYYDLVIDAASLSALDVRALLAGVSGRCGHFLMISSCDVYPAVPRLRPWRESDADVCEDLPVSLSAAARTARELERELKLGSAGTTEYTILRPAIVEGVNDPAGRTLWFVQRILNGGLLVLPDGDLPLYRHVSVEDLAQAVAIVAGRKEAFGQTFNVVGHGVLNYWGHSAMIRDGLGHELRFAYVPAWRWRAAGLHLPMGETASPSFIEESSPLRELGWQPGDDLTFVMDLARQCREQAVSDDESFLVRERQVLAEFEASPEYQPGIPEGALPQHHEPQSLLQGWAGQPASLTLSQLPRRQNFPTPVVQVCALAPGPSEERLLKGEYPQQGARAIGHNALLEVLDPGTSGLAAGASMLAFGAMPCEEPHCPFCAGGAHGVLGIGCDGYGWSVCTTPPSHLLPVPEGLEMTALLADPLAALLAALAEPLRQSDGAVWVAGRTVEAALAAWLVEDAGRPLFLVDRRAWDHDEFPVQAVGDLERQVLASELSAPELAIDFTGSTEVTWPMAIALATGGHLYGRSRPLGITHGRHWHILPSAAPSRSWLEKALELLAEWRTKRDLTGRIGPAIPRQLFWDAFLPYPFTQPYLEEKP